MTAEPARKNPVPFPAASCAPEELVPVARPAPPRHVAIIMDGNGRWAQAKHLPRVSGHQRGAQAVKRIVRSARDLGIECLTLFAFSSENWKRPAEEVHHLMRLFRLYLAREIRDLHANAVRLRVIGDRSRLHADLVELIDRGEELTRDNRGMTLVVALNYGGQREIVNATRRIAEAVGRGEIRAEDIDDDTIHGHLETADLPDPDLIIRTSGEKRLSNFLIWQSAYAELVFVDTLWPDFHARDLEGAIEEFHRRERRFGSRPA